MTGAGLAGRMIGVRFCRLPGLLAVTGRRPRSVSVSGDDTLRSTSALTLPQARGDVVELPSLCRHRAQELCEGRGGRPGLPSLISLRFLWT